MQTAEFFTKAIEKLDVPWCYNPKEAGWLIFQLRKRRPVHFSFLEIGSYKGGSAFAFNTFLNIRRTSICDLHPREDRSELLKELEIPECQELSEEFLRCIAPIDLIHFDGDHTKEGLKDEWDVVRPHINKGTFVVVHDTVAPDVASFVSLLQENGCQLIDKISIEHGVALLHI